MLPCTIEYRVEQLVLNMIHMALTVSFHHHQYVHQ